MKNKSGYGVLLLGLVSACGGSRAVDSVAEPGAPAASASAPAAPASELRPEHLPPTVAFARFGETTPEEVKAQFTAPNLYVTDDGERDLRVGAVGPNTGRPQRTVFVTRTQDGSGYVGALGDDYGSITFAFTTLREGGPFVLYRIEVSQRGANGGVCEPAMPLAAGTGLEGCDPNDVYRPSAPAADGAFHACINHTEQRVMLVRCTASRDSRTVRYELALGRQEPPAAP